MEEAYAQLYQEFVRLRSLCLRQASLLHKLTAALRQQQGEINGDVGSLSQLDSEYPVYLSTTLHPPALLTQAAPCDAQEPSKDMGNFSELLAQDMSKLSVETSVQKTEPRSELSVPQSLSSVMALSQGASYNKCLRHNGDDTLRNGLMSVTPNTNFIHAQPQSGGAMMSDVALQSQVCEFCHAVFPSGTTTRGQYLQHLYTHIT